MDEIRVKRIKSLISSLRSGEYAQGGGALRTDKGFCCLGVACDVYSKENENCKWVAPEDGNDQWIFDNNDVASTSWLSIEIADWFGFTDNGGYAPLANHEYPLYRAGGVSYIDLMAINDACIPFTTIADILDDNLKLNKFNLYRN